MVFQSTFIKIRTKEQLAAMAAKSHTGGLGSFPYCSPGTFYTRMLFSCQKVRDKNLLYKYSEQLHGQRYSEKSDVFSLGIIFCEMQYKFSTESER